MLVLSPYQLNKFLFKGNKMHTFHKSENLTKNELKQLRKKHKLFRRNRQLNGNMSFFVGSGDAKKGTHSELLDDYLDGELYS